MDSDVPPCCQLIASSQERVRLKIGGKWNLRQQTPKWGQILSELEAKPSIEFIDFETSELTEWDSSLLVFLSKLCDYCTSKGIQLNQSNLPDGARGILALVEVCVTNKTSNTVQQEHRSIVYHLGKSCIALAQGVRETLGFLGETSFSFKRLVQGKARLRMRDFWLILQQCGAEALPIVALISFLVGFTLAFVGAVQLQEFGASIYVANLVGLGMVREMGAMMAAVIVCGRSGAAFASQIGSMKVSEEIDALKTLGISPIDFLVLPRMVALFLMMPLLCLFADLIGILGGMSVGVGILDLSPVQYLRQTQNAINLTDCSTGVIKSTVFGALVVATGCLRGMQAGRSSAAVGEAATSAVVSGITAIIIADSIFTVIFNILEM